MSDAPKPFYDKLEPGSLDHYAGINPVQLSQAISLRRIADALDHMNKPINVAAKRQIVDADRLWSSWASANLKKGSSPPVDADRLWSFPRGFGNQPATPQNQAAPAAPSLLDMFVGPAHHPAPAIPEGFTPWPGGVCPVDFGTRVDVYLRSGITGTDLAAKFSWYHAYGDANIIAYRVSEPAEPAVPEGWTAWPGGVCPVGENTRVDVSFRNGQTASGGRAGPYRWTHDSRHSDIVAYRVSEGWTAWLGGQQPVPTGTIIDVDYRDGTRLLAVPAGRRVSALPEAKRTPGYGTDPQFWCNEDCPNDIVAYRVHVDAEGFIAWGGATESPVGTATKVDVKLRNNDWGTYSTSYPGNLRWTCTETVGDIIAYRQHAEPEAKPDPQWIPWSGGPCPVDDEAKVEIQMRDGSMNHGRAARFYWLHYSNHSQWDIVAYKLRP